MHEGDLSSRRIVVGLPARQRGRGRRATSSRSCENLKAIVEDDRCTLMATDLELGIRLDVRGLKVEEPGEAILPAARLIVDPARVAPTRS